MKTVYEALWWAAFVLIVAWMMKSSGASDAAAFGVVAGLSGAAVGSLSARRTKKEC